MHSHLRTIPLFSATHALVDCYSAAPRYRRTHLLHYLPLHRDVFSPFPRRRVNLKSRFTFSDQSMTTHGTQANNESTSLKRNIYLCCVSAVQILLGYYNTLTTSKI